MSMSSQELATVRAEIDQIDTKLLHLLTERMALARAVARAKQHGPAGPIFRPQRETDIVERLTAMEELPGELIHTIWKEIFSASRYVQDDRPIAVCDKPGSALHFATHLVLGRSLVCTPCANPEAVETLLRAGTCSLGVFSSAHAVPKNLRVIHTQDVLALIAPDASYKKKPDRMVYIVAFS